MKTKIITFIFLTYTFVLFGQIPKTAISIEDSAFNEYFFNKKNVPVVKGRILNVPEEEIGKIKVNYSIVTPFEERMIKKSALVKVDGTFELELSYVFPFQQITIIIGDLYYAEIYANTDLLIELDFKILKSSKTIFMNRELNGVYFNGPGVKYSGNDGALNNFMNNHILYSYIHQLESMKELENLKNDEKSDYRIFLNKYDSIYNKLTVSDNEYININPSKYAWLIENDRLSEYYGFLVQNGAKAKEVNENLWKKISNHKSYLTSTKGMQFYSYLDNYLSFKSENSHYQSLFNKNRNSSPKVIDSLRVKFSNRGSVIRANERIAQLDSIFKTPKADFLKLKISSPDPQEQNLINKEILKGIKTEWCRTVIREESKKAIQKLNAINKILVESQPLNSIKNIGKPISKFPFGAQLYVVDSLNHKELMANLKTAFKGKALLIDFWATWCAPCIQDMPYSKKLHNEAKDLPIEFIYLCTSRGSSIDKWKSKIAEFKQPGIHLFVSESITNELMELFSVSGVPSYIFINSKGEYKSGVIRDMSTTDKNQLESLIE